jgi:hypothetical protein
MSLRGAFWFHDSRTSFRIFRNYKLLQRLVAFQKRFWLLELPLAEIRHEFDRHTSNAAGRNQKCRADQDTKNSTGERCAAVVLIRDNQEA